MICLGESPRALSFLCSRGCLNAFTFGFPPEAYRWQQRCRAVHTPAVTDVTQHQYQPISFWTDKPNRRLKNSLHLLRDPGHNNSQPQ